MIKTINKGVDWLEGVAMTVLMLIATVVAIIQVIARYVFSNSLYWSEETILYSLITMSFLAASMGVRYSAHISVEILQIFAGPRLARVLKFISILLGVLFAVTLIYYGWQLFIRTNKMGQLSPAMRIPVAYVYLSIPISGTFMLLRYLSLFESLIRKKEPPTVQKELIAT